MIHRRRFPAAVDFTRARILIRALLYLGCADCNMRPCSPSIGS